MPQVSNRLAVVAAALSPDARQAAVAARVAGFGGLQFDAHSPSLNLPALSATGRREFLHVLSSQNVRLVALSIDLGAKGLGPGADVDRILAEMRRVLESAAALATPLVCCDLGPLPEPPPAAKSRPPITKDQAGLILLPTFAAAPAPETSTAPIPPSLDPVFAAQVDGALVELGTLADRIGVTVAFRSDLASFAALHRALTAARCPWFGIDLDPVAILRDAWEQDEIFSQLGPLIRHVRARDGVRGADRRTKPTIIGAGDIHWPQLLSDLDAAGYHGWLTLDPMELSDRPAAAAKGAKHLASLLGKSE